MLLFIYWPHIKYFILIYWDKFFLVATNSLLKSVPMNKIITQKHSHQLRQKLDQLIVWRAVAMTRCLYLKLLQLYAEAQRKLVCMLSACIEKQTGEVKKHNVVVLVTDQRILQRN